MMTLAQLEPEILALPFRERAVLTQQLLESIASEYSQKAKQLQALIEQGDADIGAGRVTEFTINKALLSEISRH